jgi:prepilin-type N-terminal cleavage/methylation domain-containing protein
MTGERCIVAPRRFPRGLSLIEVTLSIVVVGVMMTAALSTLSSVSLTRHVDANAQIARSLADQLMAEILSKEYEDPGLAPGSFGISDDEAATGDRSLFDDVDDYDGWSASPPETADGVAIADRSEWARSVEVEYVSPVSPTSVTGGDSGAKRITVKVSLNGNEVFSLVGVKGRTTALP